MNDKSLQSFKDQSARQLYSSGKASRHVWIQY